MKHPLCCLVCCLERAFLGVVGGAEVTQVAGSRLKATLTLLNHIDPPFGSRDRALHRKVVVQKTELFIAGNRGHLES